MGIRIDRLGELRRARGLTQAELSQRARLSMTTISLLERGYPIATIRTIHHLAHALGVPAEDLLRQASVADEGSPTKRP